MTPDGPSAAVHIRRERPEDGEAIRTIHRDAFGGDDEARLVDALRARGGDLLSIVAEIGGVVVGHVLFSRVDIGTLEGAGLAPMAVAPSWQRRGIGSQLVTAGLEHLRRDGCPFVVVVGHPQFYPRFGFESAVAHGVTCQWDLPAGVFMIAVLSPQLRGHVGGHASYAPEFSAFS